MDWKKTFNRGQWVIHGIFILSVLMGIGSTILALRLNHLQQTEEERTIKINSLINRLRSENDFEKIGKLLSRAESDKANDKLRVLAQKIVETEEILEIKSSNDLGLAMRTFHKLVNNASGISNPVDALKVLGKKVSSLQEIADSKDYKNVGIISKRMLSRLLNLNPSNVGTSVQVSYLGSDAKRMETLVAGSTLTDEEKNSLLSRIKSMENELTLLNNLNSHAKDLKAHVTKATLALAQWLLDAEKKAGDFKGMLNRKQNQLILLLAGMVAFMVCSWMGIAYLFRWQKVRIGEQVENEVKGVIEKGIMADQRFMVDHYSDLTRDDIIRLLDELKVKLNLGTMLHEGLPFPGCMIDKNFKLTWNNHLFLEQFYLSEEEVSSEAFNWDYLREYLNLDEDPVYQALVNKIAGIYPVKVKQDEFTPMQPYEMYVTPITVNREDRVMVFFYPLVAVKEAIEEQVNLARETLGRFVQLWSDDELNEEEKFLLEKDFQNNDMDELFRILIDLQERTEGEKDECIQTIRSLEEENGNYHSILEEMKRIEEERKSIIKQEFFLAESLKENFITSLERAESLLQINRSVLQQNDDLKTEALKMQQASNEVTKKTKETLEIMGQLEAVKVDYKKLKLELLEVKAKLIMINSSLFAQMPPLDDHQQKLANRYKDELARLDFNVVTFDKKLSQLDVLLAKLQMMHEKNPSFQTNFNFQTTQKDHELRDVLLGIQKALNAEEGKIIEHFKSLHQLMRNDLGKTHEASAANNATSEALLS